MLEDKLRLEIKFHYSFCLFTQFDSSIFNMVDQSLPRRLVGQPRRAYSRTAFKFDFFSKTNRKQLTLFSMGFFFTL